MDTQRGKKKVKNRLPEFQPPDNQSSENLIRQSSGYILPKGGIEIKWFNNLYTQTAYFNSEWNMKQQDGRSNYFTSSLEGLFGISKRLNIGGDVLWQSVHLNGKGDNPLDAVKPERNKSAHHALTGFFPKIKWMPVQSFQNLTLESGIFIPTAKNPEGQNGEHPFLAPGRFEWWTEFFYVNNFAQDFQFFAELDAYYRFGENTLFGDQSAFNSPAKLFVNYYPFNKWSIYAMAEFNPTWGNKGLDAAYYQNGLGVKYQLTGSLEIEALYTNFMAGKSSGAGQTFNLGLRFQRN